jgi:GAF domain-containing protein
MADQSPDRFAMELRDALILASTAGTIASPVTHSQLLELIVETAIQVIAVRAGALFLINEETQELVFAVALGHKAEEARKFTVPLGRGIAGLVAVTGQPMAISDVERDPRLAPDIAGAIGYMPQSILCVPLSYNGRITGVLEFLDKEGAPSFSAKDMEILGLFANQAAVAIEQSRTHQNLVALMSEVLASLGGVAEERKARLAAGAPAFAHRVEADPAYADALDLARLVQEIVWQGDAERRACQGILEQFAAYARARPSGGREPNGAW